MALAYVIITSTSVSFFIFFMREGITFLYCFFYNITQYLHRFSLSRMLNTLLYTMRKLDVHCFSFKYQLRQMSIDKSNRGTGKLWWNTRIITVSCSVGTVSINTLRRSYKEYSPLHIVIPLGPKYSPRDSVFIYP